MISPPLDATQTKALLKILIGAAWLDGVIQPEERRYLHKMAQGNQLAQDPEIKKLFSEAQPIAPADCMQWIMAYLRQYHTDADYQALLESLSALIYSDGDVQVEEAKVLMQVQEMAPQLGERTGVVPKILTAIQTLYKRAVQSQS